MTPRTLNLVRAGFGAVLLVRPAGLLARLGGRPPDTAALIFARVLGARQLTEAAVSLAFRSDAVIRAGAVVDGIHAATAFGLAETDHHRRLALWNTAGALGFGAAGVAAARRGP